MAAEIDARLATLLDEVSDDQWLDVILELKPVPVAPGASRAETIAVMRAAFQTSADVVKATVQRCGGTVVDEAWINSTLKCHLPARAVKQLGRLGDIARIDVPHRMAREA